MPTELQRIISRILNMKFVRIANPLPGGKTCTSPKRAAHFLRAGRCVVTNDDQLFFVDAPTLVTRRERQAEEEALKYYNGGVCLWNGRAPKRTRRGPSLHKPGEVCS